VGRGVRGRPRDAKLSHHDAIDAEGLDAVAARIDDPEALEDEARQRLRKDPLAARFLTREVENRRVDPCTAHRDVARGERERVRQLEASRGEVDRLPRLRGREGGLHALLGILGTERDARPSALTRHGR